MWGSLAACGGLSVRQTRGRTYTLRVSERAAPYGCFFRIYT
jgi:hypothetical protein